MRADFEYFPAFAKIATDFEQFFKTKLSMSVLVFKGEKTSEKLLIEQAGLVRSDID